LGGAFGVENMLEGELEEFLMGTELKDHKED